MQGKSLRGLVNGNEKTWRNSFMIEHRFKYETIPRSEGVVSKNWKYVHFLDRDTTYEWLFNVKEDPFEINNLAKDIKYQNMKNEIKEQLKKMKQMYK
jgi:arylsulfatase A-like enzyme